MQSSTITSRGQTTVPSEIRRALNLKAGDKVRYLVMANGDVRMFRVRSVMELAGILYRPGQRTITLEEMDNAIAEGAAASL